MLFFETKYIDTTITNILLNEQLFTLGDILSISPSGVVEFAGKLLRKGFIVDNKIFVVADGGVDRFFDNTGTCIMYNVNLYTGWFMAFYPLACEIARNVFCICTSSIRHRKFFMSKTVAL